MFITLNLPNLADGAEVELDGLGKFINGKTTEVTDEEEVAFRESHSDFVDVMTDAIEPTDDHPKGKKPVVVGSKRVPGPSLEAWFEHTAGITVSKEDPSKADEESESEPKKATRSRGGDNK